ncbi:hypothetical protein HOK51_10060 [Candidatus Woesearchaeota archaeon]|nr:hypothetical protein [Candidatus Woesearchaeota archaeon]MBT6520168.1 hypothetical protein [Candidatus Woesearchaeota archaeon]MBT7367206.1 hypothetical protein [Candidatus Woesearchaeota archaeon]
MKNKSKKLFSVVAVLIILVLFSLVTSSSLSEFSVLTVASSSVNQLSGFSDSNKNVFHFTAKMSIDADGSPRAYHPTDNSLALDNLGNAGSPGNWWGISTDSKGNPYIQTESQPYPGFYISTTALSDGTKKNNDPARYVDSEKIPYFVLSKELKAKLGAKLGDVGVVISKNTGKKSGAIFADVGPGGKIGEASIKLAENLGFTVSAKKGGTKGEFVYVVFPGSGNGKPLSEVEINSKAAQLFDEELQSFFNTDSLGGSSQSASSDLSNTILHIGDSHTVGWYGKAMDLLLRSGSNTVRTYAISGSRAGHWVKGHVHYSISKPDMQNKLLGYSRYSDEQGTNVPLKTKTSLKMILETYSPTIIIISLGSNHLSQGKAKQLEKIKTECGDLAKIASESAKCIWVGPPKTTRINFKDHLDTVAESVKQAVTPYCTFVDSRDLANITKLSDGIHYNKAGSDGWAQNVFSQLDLAGTQSSQQQTSTSSNIPTAADITFEPPKAPPFYDFFISVESGKTTITGISKSLWGADLEKHDPVGDIFDLFSIFNKLSDSVPNSGLSSGAGSLSSETAAIADNIPSAGSCGDRLVEIAKKGLGHPYCLGAKSWSASSDPPSPDQCLQDDDHPKCQASLEKYKSCPIDCSSYTAWVYMRYGEIYQEPNFKKHVSRSARWQGKNIGVPVDGTPTLGADSCTPSVPNIQNLEKGDLILMCGTYDANNDGKKGCDNDGITHVGMYMGDDKLIHAGHPVKIVPLSTRKDYAGATRLCGTSEVN